MKLILALTTALLSSITVPSVDEPGSSTDSLSSIVISATRAVNGTPVTRTELNFRDMDLPSDAASLPRALALQPSAISTTEGANPLGYSTIRIRGVSTYATNVTLNGITLNDAESQEVFWVNLPCLSSIASSVQVQRGLGTSSSGPGAFGASINLSSGQLEERLEAELSAASFGTRGMNFSGSHSFGAPFLQLSLSSWDSDGYIRNAPSEVSSIYACGGWKDSRTIIKGTFLRGEQHTGITWEGVPFDIFPLDPRYNACPGASDNFCQSHFQLSASHDFGPLIWTGTLNYTDGRGYYEYPADASSDGTRDFTASGLSVLRSELIWRAGNIQGTSGLYLSRYDGEQWETAATNASEMHCYDNQALKSEQDVWTRAQWGDGKLDIYGDLHLRMVQHRISGTDWYGGIPAVDETWLFFSPRAGANLKLGSGRRVYGSIALGHREPARSDILASPSRPEHLTDIELGYGHLGERFSLGATLYAMEYSDMLQETGELSIAGYAIKANVPRAHRRGVELYGSARPAGWISLDGNLTLSTNRRMDSDGRWGNIVLSPSTIASLAVEIRPLDGTELPGPLKALRLRSETKYVGEQNWSDDGLIPSYCVTDLTAGSSMGAFSLDAFLVNVTDLRYYAGAHSGGVYPQAPRSFMLRLKVKIF